MERWASGGLAYAVVLALVAAYFVHRRQADLSGLQPFWDAHVYKRAFEEWMNGADPYRVSVPGDPRIRLPFVSPPVFLFLLTLAHRVVPGQLGWPLSYGLSAACALAIPVLLATFYMPDRWMTAPVAAFLTWFFPGRYGSQALLTGNLSNVLYAVLLAAGALGLRKNRWALFYAAVIFAGLMKPPFLAFLLLPLLLGVRQWMGSVLAVLVVLVGDLAQRYFYPGLWSAFQQAVVERVFLAGDAGFGLMGQMLKLGGIWTGLRSVSPAMLSALVAMLLLSPLVLLARRYPAPRKDASWVACVVVLAVLCNPRVLDYDATVAVAPALFLVVEFARCTEPRAWRRWQAVALCFVFGLLVYRQAQTGFCVLCIASVLMTEARLLWPRSFRDAGQPSSADGDVHAS